MKDIFELFNQQILDGSINIKEYIEEPMYYQTTRGAKLFGFQTNQISKAALCYDSHLNKLEFNEASQLLSDLKISLAIEELALIYKRALFLNKNSVPFLRDVTSMREIIIELYRRFSGLSDSELRPLVDRKMEIYKEKWHEVVKDEDNVTLEQLGQFYNSLPFPVGCFLTDCIENSLVIAYRTLPILLAQSTNSKKFFDFGGNSGQLTTAMAAIMDLEACYLIEENETFLNCNNKLNYFFNSEVSAKNLNRINLI